MDYGQMDFSILPAVHAQQEMLENSRLNLCSKLRRMYRNAQIDSPLELFLSHHFFVPIFKSVSSSLIVSFARPVKSSVENFNYACSTSQDFLLLISVFDVAL
jgi:hypothetical protein